MKRGLVTFVRILHTGAVNFIRNPSLAVAAMAVMIITLTIVLFSVVANATFVNTIAQITNKIDISVYLEDSTDEATGRELADRLGDLSNAKSVIYLSKAEVLERFKQEKADNSDILSAINQTGNNPLPATIQIKPKNLDRIPEIRDFLDKPTNKGLWNGVSYSDDRKEAIDKIAHATNLLRKAGLAAVVIFAVVSMLIIFNTIQMAIFNRREELTIMRLLGATTWYIRGPFVVETMLYGLVAAVVSIILINSLFLAASSALQASSLGLLDIGYASRYFAAHFWSLLGMQLVLGILIGTASSTIATRRYLKFHPTK